jgi:hypothetical protein
VEVTVKEPVKVGGVGDVGGKIEHRVEPNSRLVLISHKCCPAPCLRALPRGVGDAFFGKIQ